MSDGTERLGRGELAALGVELGLGLLLLAASVWFVRGGEDWAWIGVAVATTLAGFAVAGFVTRAWIGALFAGVVLVSAGMVFVGVVREQDAYLLAGMTCFVLAALAAPVVHLLARLAARAG